MTAEILSLYIFCTQVRIFSLEDQFNCIHTLDLTKFLKKYQNQRDEEKVINENIDIEEPGISVLQLIYAKKTTPCDGQDDDDYHVTR